MIGMNGEDAPVRISSTQMFRSSKAAALKLFMPGLLVIGVLLALTGHAIWQQRLFSLLLPVLPMVAVAAWLVVVPAEAHWDLGDSSITLIWYRRVVHVPVEDVDGVSRGLMFRRLKLRSGKKIRYIACDENSQMDTLFSEANGPS